MSDPTLDLAKQLVSCRSLTPDDGGALDLVADRLARVGFVCERVDRGGVRNLWATHGSGAPLVCFAGHVDVVPPGPVEKWTSDPFTPAERDGNLYGRGVADMKAGVAAMVTAAERVAAPPGHKGTIAVLLTSDEEGEAAHGTIAVVDMLRSRGISIDACILGEPTSSQTLGDAMKHGRRGSLHGALTVNGVQCHIAYPEKGKNPIHLSVPALAELVRMRWDEGDESFAPTSFQISNVRAGAGANNVIPGAMEVVFNFRFSPASPAESLKTRVHAVLDSHHLDYDLTWTLGSEPFITKRGRLVSALTEAIVATVGIKPELSTGGGTSDGRFLAAISKELVEFGPVNATIHAIDEHVRVVDLAPLSTIYERTLTALLA
jgi:succinyl-diaminopimelate desuccinylase